MWSSLSAPQKSPLPLLLLLALSFLCCADMSVDLITFTSAAEITAHFLNGREKGEIRSSDTKSLDFGRSVICQAQQGHWMHEWNRKKKKSERKQGKNEEKEVRTETNCWVGIFLHSSILQTLVEHQKIPGTRLYFTYSCPLRSDSENICWFSSSELNQKIHQN